MRLCKYAIEGTQHWICAYAMAKEIENSIGPFVINSGVSQKSSDTMWDYII
jgi:hypothetical protein